MDAEVTRCGLVAIVGRPNVGKSTLLNRLLGQKLSITSRKPQTTRHRILGIKTESGSQAIYVDTPGLHVRRVGALNRYMNRAASETIKDVDVVIWVVDANRWTADDDHVWSLVEPTQARLIVAVNKIDMLAARTELLPILARVSASTGGVEQIPISARGGDNVDKLEQLVSDLLPRGPAQFPADQLTDRSSRFVASEFIREQFINRLGQEVPYKLSVEIEYFEQRAERIDIGAVVWVERASQKGIIVGKQGHLMKAVGSQARHQLSELFETPVNIRLWAKVKPGWSDDQSALKSLGYD